MQRWDNSLSMTFHCSNGIRHGGQLSPLLYNVQTDDQNHHFQATSVGCYVGGTWVNSLSYAEDLRWCGTGGFQEQGQCLFIGLAARSIFVSYSFPFFFFHLWVGIVGLGSSN